MKRQLISWMSTWPFWAKNIVYTVWLKTTRAGRVANERERLVVSSWDEIVDCGEFYHVMHAHRYWWADKKIQRHTPKTVLDLGCGSGYGTWYLNLRKSRAVYGYDLDTEAISWAQDHFGSEELEFDVELPDTTFDYIVCFEVIEHDPDEVIKTIFNHLEPNGLLIISTPNAEQTSVRQWLLNRRKVVLNHTHVREYTAPEFINLLSPYFKQVEVFGQCPKNVRNFYDYEEWRRKRGVTLDDFHMSSTDFVNCEVIVALCKGFIK